MSNQPQEQKSYAKHTRDLICEYIGERTCDVIGEATDAAMDRVSKASHQVVNHAINAGVGYLTDKALSSLKPQYKKRDELALRNEL